MILFQKFLDVLFYIRFYDMRKLFFWALLDLRNNGILSHYFLQSIFYFIEVLLHSSEYHKYVIYINIYVPTLCTLYFVVMWRHNERSSFVNCETINLEKILVERCHLLCKTVCSCIQNVLLVHLPLYCLSRDIVISIKGKCLAKKNGEKT